MKALLLGSIGTLADTSELQRQAFNDAFREHGLDWHWERDEYRYMLRTSGGTRRIAAQAEAEDAIVDADAVHATKSRRFQELLSDGAAEPRPGVPDLIARARAEGVKLGFVTTTSAENVSTLLSGLDIDRGAFDVVVTRGDVAAPKPAPDCYLHAADRLGIATGDCLAVEDNVDGARAAMAAGMTCLAWPNGNTQGHDFGAARPVEGDIGRAVWAEAAS